MSHDEIRAALAAATPGPWYWRNTQDPMLMGGRAMLVMSFERMGMQGAQPLFRDGRNIMQPGGRANLNDFPDAHLIANAPTWLADLLAEVDRLTAGALPDPAGGCVCEHYTENRGGVYSETMMEYEPACPEHSQHVYNPRTGVWELGATARAEAAERAVQRVRALAYDWRHQPTNSDTEQQIADGTSILRALDGGES